ncbi:MAG TPA: hypothetical protein VJL37_06125 [Flavobacterium sp.]|nr:hypothetical protein [Flavobacterium sp.]
MKITLIPQENLVYNSNLQPAELTEELRKHIHNVKRSNINWYYDHTGVSYNGTVTENQFKISRVINYRNSFLPVITGKIEGTTSGSRVHVEMQLTKVVKYFSIFWLTGVFFAFIAMLIGIFPESSNNQIPPFVPFMPIGMLVIVTGAMNWGFKYESKKSKKDLEDILNAKLEKQL